MLSGFLLVIVVGWLPLHTIVGQERGGSRHCCRLAAQLQARMPHKLPPTNCVTKHGGNDLAGRKAKHWLVLGASCADKADHWSITWPGDRPTFDQLEALRVFLGLP